MSYPKDFALHETIAKLSKEYRGIKHLVVIGIGGSNLGTEAVHSVLDTGKVELSVLDKVSVVLPDLLMTQTAICETFLYFLSFFA